MHRYSITLSTKQRCNDELSDGWRYRSSYLGFHEARHEARSLVVPRKRLVFYSSPGIVLEKTSRGRMEGGSTDKILAGVASEAALGCEESSDQCGDDDRVHAKHTRLNRQRHIDEGRERPERGHLGSGLGFLIANADH